MSSGHSHAPTPGKPGAPHQRSLWIALALTSSFMVAEVIGGVITGSLALISDAAHMFTDTAALAIALAAMQIAKRPVDARRTFGYHRFEILAAAFNALLLFGAALYILFEAWERFSAPPSVDSVPMLIVASVGLAVNMISMRLLASGKDGSLNVKGAYLEVWSDMLGSLGVIVGAIVIWLTGWTWIDTLIAVAIGLWVLPRTWTLLRASVNILLEGVPDGVDIAIIEKALLSLEGVESIHDLHVWAISSGKTSLSVHMVSPKGDPEAVTRAVAATMAKDFEIHHITVQVERVACSQANGDHSFD